MDLDLDAYAPEKRNKFINLFIDIAIRVAKMSYATRLKVGAVIMTDGRIISMGWNGQPPGLPNKCEDEENKTLPTVLHAEQAALMKLSGSSESAKNASLFITHSPCIECAKLIYCSGIKEVFYKDDYRSKDGIEFLEKCKVKVIKIED